MYNRVTQSAGLTAALGAMLLLAGCLSSGDGVTARNGGGGVDNGGGGNGGGSGSFTLSLTDAPVDDAEEVTLFITGVDLKRVGVDDPVRFDFSEPLEVELLSLQGSNREELLRNRSVPPGEYEWIRLRLEPDGAEDNPSTEIFGTTSLVTFSNGEEYKLAVRDEPEVGVRLFDDFDVSPGEGTDFVIDIDLRRALIPMGEAAWEGSHYELRPAMRLVERLSSGHIAGTVDASVAGDPGCTPAVYVFEESQPPRDVFNSQGPITTGLVRNEGGTYRYDIGFLTLGEYDIALTCDADADQPDEDNQGDVDFFDVVTVEVIAGDTVEVNLGTDPL